MAIIILIIKDNTNKVVFISSKQGLSNKIKNFYLDQYINKLIDKNINLLLYLAILINLINHLTHVHSMVRIN